MILKIFILLVVSLWEFSDSHPGLYVSQIDSTEQEQQYFILNMESGEFMEISRSPEAVDSLLALGHEMRNRDSRISYHAAREALALSEGIGYRKGLAEAFNLAGIKYLDFGEYDDSMEHFLKAIEIHEEFNNQDEISTLLGNIALVHIEEENFEKAAEYLSAGIEKQRELGEYEQAYRTINNLGVVDRRQGDYDQAMIHFKQAEKLSLEAASDSILHMIATLNIGNTYRNKGDLDQAEGYLKKAKNYFEQQGYRNNLIVANLLMGQLYHDRKQFEDALQFAYKSLELAQDERQRERIKDAHELVAQTHEKLGEYQDAYHHYQLFHQLSDTLQNIQRSNQINEMQMRFEVDQKNHEIELLNKEYALQEAQIAQQNMMRNGLLVGVFVLLGIVSLLVYTNGEKKKTNRLLKKKRKEIGIRNNQLARMSREKDEFLSIAAHDLRNPLSAIKSVAEIIQLEEKPDKELLYDYTNLIQISSDRMLNLINDLLNIQSINEGIGQNLTEKVNIKETLHQSLLHFEQSARRKNIRLTTQYHHQDEFIIGNAGNLVRIFDNLISNAIKYSPHDTQVTLETELAGDQIRISITDEGPGISSEDQGKLFSRFAKLSNRPTGNESSTGLGLYIVKKLTLSMNGKVWCKSEPGKGTVFSVEFPREKPIKRKKISSTTGTVN